MNELTTVFQGDLVGVLKNDAVTTSLRVAEVFEKRHDNVLKAIESLVVDLLKNEETPLDVGLLKNEETPQMFFKATYVNNQNGQKYPMYRMNRDGFSLLVMGFTGKKALEWKLKYIRAFNEMEKLLLEKQSDAWRQARIAGKLTRHSETDTIKKLVEYAKAQGSEHADMLYIVYSRLADKMAGINKRDLSNTKQLNTLDEVENMIIRVIELGMSQGKQYREIFQDCKQRLEWWQDCTFRKLKKQ